MWELVSVVTYAVADALLAIIEKARYPSCREAEAFHETSAALLDIAVIQALVRVWSAPFFVLVCGVSPGIVLLCVL